jgi:hypothetical protein
MRWQAPEILTGEVEMTKETDVYAFAIACVEIVNLGKLPWGIMLEDEAVRQRVLSTLSYVFLPSLTRILITFRCRGKRPSRTQRIPIQYAKLARDSQALLALRSHSSPPVLQDIEGPRETTQELWQRL